MYDTPERPEDRLIFALDVEDEHRAKALVAQLRPHVGTFKVGLELLCRGGMDLVARIADGSAVFIDAKLHDVPATVSRAVRRIVEHGVPVRFITVHDAVFDAVSAAHGRAGILLVSVLTSVDAAALGGRDALTARVVERAHAARRDGAAGIVCAASELAAVRAAVGEDLALIVPGVRPAWAEVRGDDQRRVTTVVEAVNAGATHLVVGRPIRDAKDPAEAARRIVEEIETAGR
jgi:orotidine-5'-phosphate decarboxylase